MKLIFCSGEIYSDASARQRVLRHRPCVDEDRPLGMKVDGLFMSGGTEIGLVELSDVQTEKKLRKKNYRKKI